MSRVISKRLHLSGGVIEGGPSGEDGLGIVVVRQGVDTGVESVAGEQLMNGCGLSERVTGKSDDVGWVMRGVLRMGGPGEQEVDWGVVGSGGSDRGHCGQRECVGQE